jgi:hypothetical protein
VATTPATPPSAPRSGFASGLSALIAQVASNHAPVGLQAAFSHLVSDLQALHGTPAATGTTSTPTPTGTAGTTPPATPPATSPSKPAISLQSLLTLMQQTLGYGASSQPAATGGLLNVQA